MFLYYKPNYIISSQADYYQVDELLSEEHIVIRNSVCDFVKREIKPIIDDCAQRHKEVPDLMRRLGTLGILGPFVPTQYGGAGLDYISYGVIMQELEYGDSAIRSAASVQSSLVIYPILTYGSEDQKNKYLPLLAQGEYIGSFGLTESNHSSDPSSMETVLRVDGTGFRLNGTKMWITNAPTCDIAVVWAKDEIGKVRGGERNDIGFSTPEILNKWSLRSSKTRELVLIIFIFLQIEFYLKPP